MSDHERWSRLVDRYLAGESSPEELAEFSQLLRHDASLRTYLANVQRWCRDADSPTLSPLRVERALARVQQELGLVGVEGGSRDLQVRRVVRTSGKGWRRASIAAAVVVGLGVAMWAGGPGIALLRSARNQTSIFATSVGHRSRITLPDGSHAVLAPATRLSYSASATGPRKVTLVGEAFFDVVHLPHREFSVKAGRAIATDIGTAFDVRAYPTDSGARISVTEGHVSLVNTASAARSSDSIGAGDIAMLSGDGVTHIDRSQDVRAATGWTTGRLVFAHARLSTVVTDLGRWYGLHLLIGDSVIANEHVTLTLTTEPAEEAVAVLCRVAGASCQTRSDGSIQLATLRADRRTRANH
jgi:ferric-dicitrate binding protein FerR (iron transport regulator)